MRLPLHTTLATVAVLALGAAACGSDDDASERPVAPAPVAHIDQLSGRTTAVTLDAGFVAALASPQVTPSPIGDASIGSSGVDGFPITGGNVTYYEPGSVSPFVQDERSRDSSSLSLTGADTVVELTDFVIDPGASVLTGTVSVDGEAAAEDAPLFLLDGRTLIPLQVTDNGTAVLESTTVKLKAKAAD
jgi:hypothetical protein